MTQNLESSSKIVNPERIGRLVARMCEGQMQALIRTKENLKMGIRASFAQADNQRRLLVFDKMSDVGLSKLPVGTQIKVEVLGMPSQVMFVTVVQDKILDGIVCAMPRSLVSTERRNAARHKVTSSLPGFMSFGIWEPQANDPGCSPFFSTYRSIAGWIPLADISAGGVCLLSRFPAFQNSIEGILEDPQSFLHLPMVSPMPIHAAIRWKRKIKNRLEDDGQERFIMEYRIGVEFLNLQDEQSQRIKHYIRQLSMAEAI